MPTKKSTLLFLMMFTIILSVACGGTKLVRGEAPIVRMNELRHDGNNIFLQLSMRNRNGVTLMVQSIDFSLSIQEQELFSYNGPAATEILANGTETWTVEVKENSHGADMLNKLQSGELKSLPYAFKGAVRSQEDGKMRFEYEGHLYPVPGRPGHFR